MVINKLANTWYMTCNQGRASLYWRNVSLFVNATKIGAIIEDSGSQLIIACIIN